MHGFRPTIGVTFSARIKDDGNPRQAAGSYREAMRSHGAEVVDLVPGADHPELQALDGLLLAGGVDVDPSRYGEARHPKLGKVEPDRDDLELRLTRKAVALRMPVLGICRGAQVIGVALGGKLHQDLPSCVDCAAHAADGERGAKHLVRLTAGSRLQRVLGAEQVEVNSFHHQANSVLGVGLRAVAWADDGVIEGVEGESAGFLLGVQWHPERNPESTATRRLFTAFVEAARAYARGKGRWG